MEKLDKEKEGVLIIGTPLYPDLTLEKLRKIIEDLFNDRKTRDYFNSMDLFYQRLSPENRKIFDEALLNEANNWKIFEPKVIKNEVLKEKIVIPQLKPKIITTGKIRNKNTHLIKKKKRKR